MDIGSLHDPMSNKVMLGDRMLIAGTGVNRPVGVLCNTDTTAAGGEYEVACFDVLIRPCVSLQHQNAGLHIPCPCTFHYSLLPLNSIQTFQLQFQKICDVFTCSV